jgi:hypothetical protein
MAFQKNPFLKEADPKDLTLVKELEDKAFERSASPFRSMA